MQSDVQFCDVPIGGWFLFAGEKYQKINQHMGQSVNGEEDSFRAMHRVHQVEEDDEPQYRYLRNGEVIIKGDEVFADCGWFTTFNAGCHVGDADSGPRYRRKVEAVISETQPHTVTLDLLPLPDDWEGAEIKYGIPPVGSLAMCEDGWKKVDMKWYYRFLYAVKSWRPAIVDSGFLKPGWLAIDLSGDSWYYERRPSWHAEDEEWESSISGGWVALRETPQITGEKAIWRIE